MTPGARTPEELDTLLEDAFVLRDADGLARLFGDGALLASRGGCVEARGAGAVGHAIRALWDAGGSYVALPRRVLQARETALIIGDSAVHIARRGSDGTWRAAISLLDIDTTHIDPEEDP